MMKKTSNFLSDDFFKLFVKREWKVLLGHRYSTLWMLVAMLSATFLAISFSNASMRYLSDKMNDPFIKWVDIKNSYGEGDFTNLEYALNDSENMERFDYNSYQSDYYFSYMFFGKEKNMLQYFQCRFFQDIKTDLVSAILDEDNVIGDCKVQDLESLSDETIGVIITKNALDKLGYSETPAYLDLCRYSEGADSLGFELYDAEFARVPIPVLGVVKRLPSSVDIISTKYFYEQENNDNDYPFNLSCNHSYTESLIYYVPDEVDPTLFIASLDDAASRSTVPAIVDEYSFYKPEIVPFKSGRFISLVGENETPLLALETASMNEDIMAEWADKGIVRVFDYNFSPYEVSEKSYLSVYFNKLSKVKEFEDFVAEYKVKLDMSQINSKDNFNAVSVMANILSWAIVVFAILCIVLFIVDLLKSYFQKVKRNIGTFKAFGVSNRRLIQIYMIIVGTTLVMAIAIALAITCAFQLTFFLGGIMKEGTYNFLAIGSPKTFASIVIILCSSLETIYLVMKKLLAQTPGDLIYDRQ